MRDYHVAVADCESLQAVVDQARGNGCFDPPHRAGGVETARDIFKQFALMGDFNLGCCGGCTGQLALPYACADLGVDDLVLGHRGATSFFKSQRA